MVIFSADDKQSAVNIDETKYLIFGYRGSQAHNMYVPKNDPRSIDDVDYMGICYGPIRRYLGNAAFGSRGTAEYKFGRLDIVSYEFVKAISLLLNGNPNVLSILWNRPNNYQFKSEEGEELIKMRDAFSSKKAGAAFSGYAYAQLQKMETRDPAELRLYIAVTNEMKFRGIHPNHAGEKFDFTRESGEDRDVTNWQDDALKAKYAHYIRKGENLGYMGDKRKQLVLQTGYDSKNAAHCVRLLRMGREFMESGELNVWREKDRDELLSIKKGEWSLEEVRKLAASEFKLFEQAQEKTALPDEPNYELVWAWAEQKLRKYVTSVS